MIRSTLAAKFGAMKVVVKFLMPLVALIAVSSAQRRDPDAIVFPNQPAAGTTFLYPQTNTRVNYYANVPLNVQPLQQQTNYSHQVSQEQHSLGPNPMGYNSQIHLQSQFQQDQYAQSQSQPIQNQQQQTEPKYTISMDHSSSPVMDFAWKIFKGSKPSDTGSNLVLSPVILQFLLAVLEKAAEGETKAQLRDVLGGQSAKNLQPVFKPTSRSVQLESASGIFVEASENLNQKFVSYVRSLGTEIYGLDFKNYPQQTKEQINRWASEATHGTITELISPAYDVQQLSLILVTAIYFHSNWLFRFTQTERDYFYPHTGNSADQGIPTDFMMLKQNLAVDNIDLGRGIGGRVVEIPYESDNYAMLVIVPGDNVTLDEFVNALTVPKFESIIKNTPHKLPRLVTLKMPKFQISSRFSVVNSLLKMGVVDLFSLNSRLPHLGLRGSNKISDIIQEARLIVDENGTVASAATGSFLIPLSAAPKVEFVFNVQKPFLAVIIDKSNDIPLFISKVYKPSAYECVSVRRLQRATLH